MLKLFSKCILFIFLTYNVNPKDAITIKKDGNKIQYDHDIMRPYLSSDQLALDTEITYAKAIRLQMGGNWEKTAELYEKIANRGHPTAQVHLGKQYVHGNGVEKSLIKAYKWFYLSDTSIGRHFVKIITEDMTEKEVEIAKKLISDFKPSYD